MSARDDITYDYPPVFDEYADEDWYFLFTRGDRNFSDKYLVEGGDGLGGHDNGMTTVGDLSKIDLIFQPTIIKSLDFGLYKVWLWTNPQYQIVSDFKIIDKNIFVALDTKIIYDKIGCNPPYRSKAIKILICNGPPYGLETSLMEAVKEVEINNVPFSGSRNKTLLGKITTGKEDQICDALQVSTIKRFHVSFNTSWTLKSFVSQVQFSNLHTVCKKIGSFLCLYYVPWVPKDIIVIYHYLKLPSRVYSYGCLSIGCRFLLHMAVRKVFTITCIKCWSPYFGHGPSDGKCLSGFMVPPCSSCNEYNRFARFKPVLFGCALKCTMLFISNANSSSGQRRNKQWYSRNKNRHSEDRDGIYGFEQDSEVFSSKNGRYFLSGSSPPKFQSAATPGPRVKEVVETFRMVQARPRERAALKEEKKVEDSQGPNKTVDSLLKLLGKHSVQHGKSTTSNRNNQDFVLDHQPEKKNSLIEDKGPKELNNRVKHEVQTTDIQSRRPASNLQKRSHVPKLRYEPILTGGESINPEPYKRKETMHEPESMPEVKLETMSELKVDKEAFDEFDEGSDDEASDIEDATDEIDDPEEVNTIKNGDLSSMKLVELQEVAKTRGRVLFNRGRMIRVTQVQ